MTEGIRTLVYIGVAVLLAIAAYFSYPKPDNFEISSQINQPLFASFSDPESASRLKITKVDENLGKISQFEVSRDAKTRLWVIPSSSNYPANATDQMRDVGNSLVNLLVVDVVTSLSSEHELLGVVEPSTDLEVTQKGTGLLVEVEYENSEKESSKASLIIGKREAGNQGYFVRKPGEDPVYLVQINPTVFSTKFEDWIDKELLGVDAMDIEQMAFRDYTVPQRLEGSQILVDIVKQLDAGVSWDSEISNWQLDQFTVYQNRKPIEAELGPFEELNTSKLNEMRTALADLKIVGVARKPTGLGADLKAGQDFLENDGSRNSLMTRGFFPLQLGGGDVELYSENGEIQFATRDGIQYLVRFGRTAGLGQDGDELNRYMMVTAGIDESQFTEMNSNAPTEQTPSTTDETEEGACQDGVQDDGAEAGGGDQDSPPDPLRVDGEGDSSTSAPVSVQDPAGTETTPEETAEIRKQNELKDKYRRANAKAAELNFRFGDWYYIIADSEYRKIRLGRQDLIQETDRARSEGYDIDAFRTLQQEGLSPTPPIQPGPSGGAFPGPN